jgi:hypothetical protein
MCRKGDNQTHQSRNRLHGAHHTGKGQGACGCGCGEQRFLSEKEKLESLEEYKESLKSELERVEEELNKLKGE